MYFTNLKFNSSRAECGFCIRTTQRKAMLAVKQNFMKERTEKSIQGYIPIGLPKEEYSFTDFSKKKVYCH